MDDSVLLVSFLHVYHNFVTLQRFFCLHCAYYVFQLILGRYIPTLNARKGESGDWHN